MRGRQAAIGAAAIGAAVSAGFVIQGAAGAATTPAIRTVFAGDDAYVSSTRTKTNFGTAEKLVVGAADGETRTSLVKFTTGSFPAGATITNARLILPFDGKPVAAPISAYPVTGGWGESTVTGATMPAIGTTAAGSSVPKTTDATVTIDLDRKSVV